MQQVVALDANNCWVVGNRVDGFGLILRTTDGGTTWTRQGSPASIPDTDILKIYALDKETAWAVGSSMTILFTDDGGNTWSNKVTADVPDVLLQGVYALDKNNVWVTGFNSGGRETILRTTNGGASWINKGGPEQIFPDTPSLYMLDVSVANGGAIWACGNGYTVLRSIDNGDNWSRTYPSRGLYDANSIYGFDADNAWVVTDSDGIYRTTDGGITWTHQPLEHTNSYLLSLCVLDTQVAWASGHNSSQGVIHHTADGGVTWNKQFETTARLVGISFVPVVQALPYTGF